MKNAEWLASELFERSGVHVTWHAGELSAVPCGRWCIGIRMVDRAPASLAPGALAAARPYGSAGSSIGVYDDRVQQLLNDRPGLSSVLLAYIFAHELAHVMTGYADHSDSGIMKAQWSKVDHAAMPASTGLASRTEIRNGSASDWLLGLQPGR